MKHLLKNIVCLLVLFTSFISCRNNDEKMEVVDQELNSRWSFKQIGKNEEMLATVPGSIVTDLFANHKISDPFFGINTERLEWIKKSEWEYQTVFNMNEEFYMKRHIELIFSGLDLCSIVILNDSVISVGGSRHLEKIIECKKILKRDHNILTVRFHSPHQFCFHIDSLFFGCGILQPIHIKAWDVIKIADYQFFQESLNRERAIVKVKINLQSDIVQNVDLKISGLEKNWIDTSVVVKKGINYFELRIKIDKPKFWWTNGLGKANLYDFNLQVEHKSKVIDARTLRFGFRKLELVQKDVEHGSGSYFKLNDIPIFIKGANYLPQDIYSQRVKSDQYKHLIQSARKVNINMLRVLSGGIYENDEFYDLCDENGILIWQDFMKYEKFDTSEVVHLEKLKLQVMQNIERLRNHPSLALWCDYEQINSIDNNKENRQINVQLNSLKRDLLKQIVENIDSGRAFLPLKSDTFEIENSPQNFGQYILHGNLSYPLLSSMRSFIEEKELYRYSNQLKAHQKYPGGFELIQKNIFSKYKIPGHIIPYVYVSQLLQAENMAGAIKSYRSERGKYMGTIYQQLNDYWPAITPSGIDYYGRWKALHYYLKRVYAPVLISGQMENNTIKVFIVSDEIKSRKMKLSINLIDFYGNEIWADDMEVNVKALSSEIVYSQDLSRFLADSVKNKTMIHIKLLSGSTEIARENVYFKEVKDLDLPDPDVVFNITKKKDKFIIQIMTDYLAKNVFLDFPEDKGNFSDNYFDLLPGEQKITEFVPEYPEQKLEDKISVRSLYDVY